MTNMEASYHYRSMIAAHIREYRKRLRFVFKAHGAPVPLTPSCAFSMEVAWEHCVQGFKLAAEVLNKEREEAWRRSE